MKSTYKWMFLTSILLATPAIAADPSYEDTVTYLKAKMYGTLIENSRCQFTYKKSETNYSSFNAGHLSFFPTDKNDDFPYYGDYVSSAIFTCNVKPNCILGEDRKYYNELRFMFSERNVATQIEKSIGNLVKLCGGKVVNKDLF